MHFIQQRTSSDCGVACLAMATRRSYEYVSQCLEILKIDSSVGLTQEDVLSCLNYISKEHSTMQFALYATAWLPWDRTFIVGVPSLNYAHKGHWIVIDTSWNSLSGEIEDALKNVIVFDPQKGVEKAKYYTNYETFRGLISPVIEVIVY